MYPTPYRPALGGTLKFRRLPALSLVRLYTIAGELVRETAADANGFAEWNGKNEDGTVVAPAVYYHVIQPPTGGRSVGKFEVMK